jgi:hypothetical protein
LWKGKTFHKEEVLMTFQNESEPVICISFVEFPFL